MSPVEVLAYLQSHGVKVWADGAMLRYNAPAGGLTPALREMLLEHKREILSFLRDVQIGANSSPALIPVSQSDEPAPLSFAQERLWFLQQLMPENVAYNLPGAVHIRGVTNTEVMNAAIEEVVRRHEILRTRFEYRHGRPVQIIDSTIEVNIEIVSLLDVPPSGQKEGIAQIAQEEARWIFNLTTGPLLRVKLVKLAPNECVLFHTMHHIVSDGWSVGILEREFTQLYQAFLQGKSSPLSLLPMQYADYARWQR